MKTKSLDEVEKKFRKIAKQPNTKLMVERDANGVAMELWVSGYIVWQGYVTKRGSGFHRQAWHTTMPEFLLEI